MPSSVPLPLTFGSITKRLNTCKPIMEERIRCLAIGIDTDTYDKDLSSHFETFNQFENFWKGVKDSGEKLGDFELRTLDKLIVKISLLKDQFQTDNMNPANEVTKDGSKSPIALELNDLSQSKGIDEDQNDAYRQFSNQELLQLQQRTVEEQDRTLDLLSNSVGNQHHISLTINSELDLHNNLLDDTDQHIDHTDTRLTSARTQLNRIDNHTSNKKLWYWVLAFFTLLMVVIVFVKHV